MKEIRNPRHDYWRKFYEIYQTEMERKNAPPSLRFPWPFFQELGWSLEENVILLAVEKDEKICGGSIIVFDDCYAIHYLCGTLPELWPERVNNFMYYQCVLWAKEKGFAVFDFMGGRSGVFRFKTNFSSSRKRFYTHKRIHDQKMYDYLRTVFLHKSDNESIADQEYFPIYRLAIFGQEKA